MKWSKVQFSEKHGLTSEDWWVSARYYGLLRWFWIYSKSSRSGRLQPDVRRAVSSRISDLVGQNWTIRFFTEIHQKLLVHGETAVNGVHIDLHHHRALSAQRDRQSERTVSLPLVWPRVTCWRWVMFSCSGSVVRLEDLCENWPDHVGVELFVPAAVQRRRHIKSATVQTQLQHLRTSGNTPPLRDIQVDGGWVGQAKWRETGR